MHRPIVLTIPELPVSPNGAGGLLRMHWRSRARYFKRWQWLIRSQVFFSPCSAPKIKLYVQIHQVRSRLLDMDNLYSSCKPALDSLERLNLIYRDAPRWIDFKATQEIGKEAKTVITISEIETSQ